MNIPSLRIEERTTSTTNSRGYHLSSKGHRGRHCRVFIRSIAMKNQQHLVLFRYCDKSEEFCIGTNVSGSHLKSRMIIITYRFDQYQTPIGLPRFIFRRRRVPSRIYISSVRYGWRRSAHTQRQIDVVAIKLFLRCTE